MNHQRSYKTEMKVSKSLEEKLRQHCGVARWAYNWGLGKRQEAYKNGEKGLSSISLHKQLNELKKSEVSWMYESSKCAPQEALRNLDKAYENFFRKCKLKKQKKLRGKVGYPQFKSRKGSNQSFRLTGSIKVLEGGYVQLPRLGRVKLYEKDYLPLGDKFSSATVSYRGGKWFVSITVKEEIEGLPLSDKVVGVDLGIKMLATLSDGTTFDNPKALRNNLKKLKRVGQRHSKKARDSRNREKARLRLSKIHLRISNIRADTLHKVSSKIINENQVIVLEDLRVSNMLKNRKLSRAISDVGFGELRRQLEYKAKWRGREVRFVDTFFPSSKMCSSCGVVKESLSLSERTFDCECGLSIDRDRNASINLKNTASYAGI